MKTKIVLWGRNEKEEKILLALQLLAVDNKVNIYSYPEEIATDAFVDNMMKQWRNDVSVSAPEGYTLIERGLSITEGLLPEEIKCERGDVINRAQTEWHFIVLSSKLHQSYRSELEELKERIDKLSDFDKGMWNELKSFWDKVQVQVKDRNLFREHGNELRDTTNKLFNKLKSLRSALDAEFKKLSSTNFEEFKSTLNEVEEKIKEGLKLSSVFDQLKGLQQKLKGVKLTQNHRTNLWNQLDSAFKEVKLKRFGEKANTNDSPLERITRRYNGLMNAIDKMEKSIARDRKDLEFHARRAANSDNQLVAQLQEAKNLMIKERINSKEEKLKEMYATRTQLEGRIEKEKAKAEKMAKRANKSKKAEAVAPLAVAESPASSTKVPETESKPAEEGSLLDEVAVVVEDGIEDAIDTAKAVAAVVESKIGELVGKITSDDEDAVTSTSPTSEEE